MAKKQTPKPAKTDSESKLAKPVSGSTVPTGGSEPQLTMPASEPNLTQPASAAKPAKPEVKPKLEKGVSEAKLNKPKTEPKLAKAEPKPKHTKTESEMQFDPLRFAQPKKQPTPEERQMLIAESAYSRAASRAFEPGHEVEDWLAAEAEVDHRLNAQ